MTAQWGIAALLAIAAPAAAEDPVPSLSAWLGT